MKREEAFKRALQTAPLVEVDVNSITGLAVAPYPDWLFEEGVKHGREQAKRESEATE